MPFELTNTTATLTSVTPRTEVHGEEKVFAISLGLKIEGPNTLLDRLSPTLRTTLYRAAEGQPDLPGIEASTPMLRTRGIETLHLAGSLEGWTLEVDHGIDESAPIMLGGCKVDKFRVTPKEGGSIELLLRIGSNDIDATEAGLLCSHLSQEVSITLTAPKIAPVAPVIDGTTAAFSADHPEAGDLFAQALDGGDASIPQEGGADEGGPVEFGDPSLDMPTPIRRGGRASLAAVE